MAQCTPLLFKDLSADLVTSALERQKNGPVPGLDGVPACIYEHFLDIFVPQMLDSPHGFMAGGVPPNSWTVALVLSIPKQPGVPVVEGLRPISVCNVLLKWVTIVLLMEIEDILHQVVPMEHKGCLKGRQIMEHVWHATAAWPEMSHGFMSTVDFHINWTDYSISTAEAKITFLREAALLRCSTDKVTSFILFLEFFPEFF